MLGWPGAVILWVAPRKVLLRGVTEFSAATSSRTATPHHEPTELRKIKRYDRVGGLHEYQHVA